MQKKLKFVILTNVSSRIGYGHYNRCIILTKKLEKKNQVTLIVNAEKKIKLFKQKPWIKINFKKNFKFPKADVCIVDKYNYKEKFYRKLRSYYSRIVIFDDIKYVVPKHVTGIINPNIYNSKTFYPSNIKIWSGKKYILLRDEFTKSRKRVKKNSVFLCVGGSDPVNQMDRLLNILSSITKYKINAVFGHGFSDKKIIRKWKDNKKIKIYFGINNISNIMSRAVYAISSSGSMIYELMAMKIPTICMSLADNQINIGKSLIKSKIISYLGHYDQVSDKNILNKIKKIEKKSLIIREIKELKFDKYGSKNLANDLTEYFLKIKKNKIQTYPTYQIREEYEYTDKKIAEFKKLRWGSNISMDNRYKFLISQLPFNKVKYWLDIGSGTGKLQKMVLKKFPNVSSTGIELSKNLYKVSLKNNNIKSKFLNIDFLKFNSHKFDLITCVGVLSKTNFDLKFFAKKASNLLNKEGILFFDFKNINWDKFNQKSFFPDYRHAWTSKKQILYALNKLKKFKKIKLFGFLPEKNKVVELNKSHTIYLKAKKK